MELTMLNVALQYLKAQREHQLVEQQLHQAFRLLDQDNEVNIYGPVNKAYDELVEALLGPRLYEHTLNWIYEHDWGTKLIEDFEEYFESLATSH